MSIIFYVYLVRTLSYAEDVLFTSKPLWELTPSTPKLYTSKELLTTESVTLPPYPKSGTLNKKTQFGNRNNEGIYKNYATKPPKLYTSKELVSTTQSMIALSKIETNTKSTILSTTAATSTTVSSTTVSSTTKKPRPPKKITRFTTTSSYDITTSSPVWQNRYQTRQDNIIYPNNNVISDKFVPPTERIVYYQNPEPVMTSNNEIFSNLKGSSVYQVSPSENYRFNFKTRDGYQTFSVAGNGEPSVSFENRNGFPTEMVRDGNNYKLIVYV